MESTWETPAEAFGHRRLQRRNYQLTEEGRQARARASERYRHKGNIESMLYGRSEQFE